MAKNLIYPELMREGKWRIQFTNQKTHGRTSNDKNWMSVPQGNTPLEKFVRMHELSHAKWTPAILEETLKEHRWLFEFVGTAKMEGGYDFCPEYKDTYQVAEDGRISYLLRQKEIKSIEKGATEFYQSQVDLKNLKRCLYMGIITHAFLPEFFKPIMQHLRKENPHIAAIIRRARKLYIKYGHDFDKSTIPIIKLISEAKKQEEQKQEQQKSQTQKEKEKEWGDLAKDHPEDVIGIIVCDHEHPEERERLEKKIQEAQQKDVKEQQQQNQKQEKVVAQKHQQEFKDIGISSQYLRKQFQEDEDIKNRKAEWNWRSTEETVTWGKLTQEIVPLPKLISKKPAMRHRFADTGMRVRQIHRDDIDGMVFVESHRNFRVGSLLIDGSGSMSLSVEEIERIVLQCPGMIIGIYAGEASSGSGKLRIIAKNGKMCSKENLYLNLGGNIVDMPALQWLAKQLKPRFWVSDGKVVGIKDDDLFKRGKVSQAIIDEAFNFIKKNQILRVTNLRELEAHCLKYRM